MTTKDLIKEIQKLPTYERIYVIERSMHLLRKQEEANKMMEAAEMLCGDYHQHRELTAFTVIDMDTFYEAR